MTASQIKVRNITAKLAGVLESQPDWLAALFVVANLKPDGSVARDTKGAMTMHVEVDLWHPDLVRDINDMIAGTHAA
jgi:hypothetical protein